MAVTLENLDNYIHHRISQMKKERTVEGMRNLKYTIIKSLTSSSVYVRFESNVAGNIAVYSIRFSDHEQRRERYLKNVIVKNDHQPLSKKTLRTINNEIKIACEKVLIKAGIKLVLTYKENKTPLL